MNETDYALEFSDANPVLRVRASGSYSFRRSARMIRALGEAARARDRRLVLLDLRDVPEPVPESERFALGELAASELRELVVAFIDLTEGPDRFVETVATNRGAVIRGFLDERTALAWLGAPASLPR